jgi:hypothetical protein
LPPLGGEHATAAELSTGVGLHSKCIVGDAAADVSCPLCVIAIEMQMSVGAHAVSPHAAVAVALDGLAASGGAPVAIMRWSAELVVVSRCAPQATPVTNPTVSVSARKIIVQAPSRS